MDNTGEEVSRTGVGLVDLDDIQEQLDTIKRWGISESAGDFQGTFLTNDIPDLLTEVRRLRAVLVAAKFVVDELDGLDGDEWTTVISGTSASINKLRAAIEAAQSGKGE